MTLIVVDASVAVKWFLPEPHSLQALRLLEGERELLAPNLVWAEVGNVLWKRWRQGELAEENIPAILEAFRKVPLLLHPAEEIAKAAWSFASQFQRSFYDSLYLALASSQSCSMVTASARPGAADQSRTVTTLTARLPPTGLLTTDLLPDEDPSLLRRRGTEELLHQPEQSSSNPAGERLSQALPLLALVAPPPN